MTFGWYCKIHIPLLKFTAAAAAKSLQSCPTLCNSIDGSPPGSPVTGILQARTLEWVAISFSNAWKWKVKVKSFIRVWLPATPWTAAYQAPPSMGFSRQEHWSFLLFQGYPVSAPTTILFKHGGSDSKELPAMWEAGSISGSGSFPLEENSYPVQYSCPENLINRGVLSTLAGYSPWGRKRVSMTEQLTLVLH